LGNKGALVGRYTVHLVGETHYQHVIRNLQPGTPVKLVADPENRHDPRAVKAAHAGETIGYVERDSWLIRAMYDDRTAVASRVQEIIGGGPGEMKGVVLEVRTGTDAEEALGRSTSQSANAMPPPAANSAKNRGCGFGLMAGLAVFVVLAIIATEFGPTKEERAARDAEEARHAEQEATNVTAMQLWQAYEANEPAAQQAYGDKPLRITGTVDGVQLDFSDEPFVTLATGNMFQSVQLQFANPSDPAIPGLRKGNQVTAVCTDVSEVVGTPILDGCVLR
jgi:hypothetical protein